MKICFLTLEYPHPKTGISGGIGTSLLNLSKALVQLGHNVTIIVYGQDNDENFEDSGIIFYKVKNIKFKGLSFYLTQKKVEKLLNSLHKQKLIDIVEVPDWTGFSAFIKPNCPLVLRLNGSDTYFCYLDKRPVKWQNKYFEQRAFKQADGVISVSKFTGDLTNTIFKCQRNFKVIGNGINCKQFKELQIAQDSETILYFGTLIRKKGLLELPPIFNEVFKKNPKAKLLLIGKDASDIISGAKSTWKLMQPLFNKNSFQNVYYLGSVPYEKIQKEIAKATVCVFPTFAEALPVSWLEAMAMKKPIVACNIGWASEIIDDGVSGFLVNPTNHIEYANKICTLLNDTQLQLKLGYEARNKVMSNFDSSIIAQKSIEFYKMYL